MHRKILKGLLLFNVILFFSLFFIINKTFTPETFKALRSLNKFYLFLSFFFLFLVHTFDNLRLFIIARSLGVKYSFLYGYVISLINTFGATVTPAHVGGEGTAVYMLLRKGVSAHKVATIVTLKTLTGLVFFVIAFPYLLLTIPISNTLLMLFIFTLFLILSYALFKFFLKRENGFFKKCKIFLRNYLGHLRYFYRRKKLSFILASFSAVMLYVCFLLIGYFLLLAFNKDTEPFEVLKKQIGLLYAIFVSPTPGGSGVGEIGGMVVFSGFLNKHELGIFVILWRFVSQYISAFIGGIIFFLCIIADIKRYS
ncbi:UPF0104 family protein [Aquifex pyrophilus]